jgi:hypothetical protein
MSACTKIVVFDLDETLGYFTQLCIIWESLLSFAKNKNINTEMNQEIFNKLLDLFPEYIRPNIEFILEYLKGKKCTKKCKNVMIYTNNQRQKNWVFLIKKYFEMRLQYDLFDQIICAFKINGKHVELCRSTHNKTHKDFIKCSKIPQNTQICFIDDTYFPEMHSEEVYYIKIKPYTYNLNAETIANRVKKSDLIDNLHGLDKTEFISFLKDKLTENNNLKSKSMKEYDIDKIITKEIMNHIELFFNSQQKYPNAHFNNIHKTKKRKLYKNKTRKK